jgi:hypothetical protein
MVQTSTVVATTVGTVATGFIGKSILEIGQYLLLILTAYAFYFDYRSMCLLKNLSFVGAASRRRISMQCKYCVALVYSIPRIILTLLQDEQTHLLGSKSEKRESDKHDWPKKKRNKRSQIRGQL